MVVGTFLAALGVSVFLTPNQLSSGGITSVGTILLYLFRVPLSVTNLALNTVLFLLGYRVLGKTSVIKTSLCILLFSVFLELTAAFPQYTEDRFVAAASGGILIGLGIGVVLRVGASTGGSDFAGLLLHRFFPHVSTAVLILLIDCVVVALSGVVFRSLTVAIYSAVALVIVAKTVDWILSLGDLAKSVSVFSNKCDRIAGKVMEQFGRGSTGFYCKGMFNGNDRLMLLCVVSPKELPELIRLVRESDPGAFLVINDSREVLGEGFKNDPLYHK